MTTTPLILAATLGPHPTEAEIAEAAAALDGHYPHVYASACGGLTVAIQSLAREHKRCRQLDCWTCWHLRRGLALIAALDHITTGDPR